MRPRKVSAGVRSSNGVEELAVGGIRKKAVAPRTWLLIDSSGAIQVVQAGKHTIMRRTGLPARDLRILDPILSYPSTILGRERAIVVNLEHIKAIVTAHEVFLLNSDDPPVSRFVSDLQHRLQKEFGVEDDGDGATKSSPSAANLLRNRFENYPQQGSMPLSWKISPLNGTHDHEGPTSSKALPFEFSALEVCLEAACGSLDLETTKLEQEAYPALDELTAKISTLNLERVRQIKSHLVTISGKVQKVRDELEQLLDDDGDMAEMYLTNKLMDQADVQSLISLDDDDEFADEHKGCSDVEGETSSKEDNNTSDLQKWKAAHSVPLARQEPSISNRQAIDSDSIHGTNRSSSGDSKHLDVAELEMLLEAYFVQIDGTLNKLSALREYVDDTEDYINIMLDDKQNQLLQMGVMLTTATLVLSVFIVITGIFGMNIRIDLFNTGTFGQFLWTIGGSTVGCIVVYAMVIGWCKWKRLLD